MVGVIIFVMKSADCSAKAREPYEKKLFHTFCTCCAFVVGMFVRLQCE